MSGDPPNYLAIRNDLSELQRVADWVQAWTEAHVVSPGLAHRLDLCSAEAVTNILSHGRGPSATEVVLRLSVLPGRLALEVHDDGAPFDPLQVEHPRPPEGLEEARIGGWGVPILRRFSDHVAYRRADGRNLLTLVFEVVSIASAIRSDRESKG